MAINLTKGQRQKVDVPKMNIGLGWDPNSSTGGEFDLDVSAFMLGENGKIPEDGYFIFYNNKFSPDGAVEGADDNTDGDGDGDDEMIKVDVSKISPLIKEIIFVVTIHEFEQRKQNFGQVRNSYIRIVDESTNTEIVNYELEEDFSIETSVEFGRLYLKNGEWKFQAMGDGYKEGLEYFLGKYT